MLFFFFPPSTRVTVDTYLHGYYCSAISFLITLLGCGDQSYAFAGIGCCNTAVTFPLFCLLMICERITITWQNTFRSPICYQKSLHYYTSTCSIILYAFIPEVEALHRFWKEKSRVRSKLLPSGFYLDLVRNGSLLVPIKAAIIPCSICLPLYPSRLSDFAPHRMGSCHFVSFVLKYNRIIRPRQEIIPIIML